MVYPLNQHLFYQHKTKNSVKSMILRNFYDFLSGQSAMRIVRFRFAQKCLSLGSHRKTRFCILALLHCKV